MKVFVTGGNGYVGSNIIRKLIQTNYQVISLIRPEASLALLEDVKDKITFVVYKKNFESVRDALATAAPDIVIHLASCFLADHRSDQLDVLVDANIKLGLYLLEAMRETGVKKLINTGTYSQYFNSDVYEPAYLYDATKQAFEDLAYFYYGAYEISMIHLILHDNYGPHDPRKKLLSFFKHAQTASQPILMSRGEQKLDLIYIDDAALAYCVAIELLCAAKRPLFVHYSVRTGNAFSLREIAQCYEKITCQPLNVQWGGLPYRPRQIMVPSQKYPILPGWHAAVSLEEGISRVVREDEV